MKWTPTPTLLRATTLPNGDLAVVVAVTTPEGETYSYHRYLVGDHKRLALDFSSGPYRSPEAPTEMFLETVEREEETVGPEHPGPAEHDCRGW